MQRWQHLTHNDTLKTLIWSSLNKISIFITFETDFFKLGFSLQEWRAHFLWKKLIEIIRIKHFQTWKNNNSLHVIYQVKVSRVPLWISNWNEMHWASLGITFTVPLNENKIWKTDFKSSMNIQFTKGFWSRCSEAENRCKIYAVISETNQRF